MRPFLWIVAVLVVFAALAWGIAWWLGQGLAETLGAALTQALGRPVTVREARIRLLPLRVDLAGLQVAGPAATDRPVLEAGRAQVLVEAGALLRGQVLAHEVRLEAPRLFLHRTAAGTDNLPRRSAWPATVAASLAPTLTWQVERLTVDQGAVEVRDEAVGYAARVEDLALEAGPIRPREPIPLRLTARWQTLGGTGTLELASARLHPAPLRLEAEQLTAAIQHASIRLPQLTIRLDLTLTPERAGGPAWAWVRAIQGQARLSAPSLALGPVALFAASAEVTAASGEVRIPRLQATVAGGTVRLDATVDGRGPQLLHRLAGQAEGVDLDALLTALGHPGRLRGTGSLAAQLRGQGSAPQALLQSLDGELTLRLANGAVLGVPVGETLRATAPLLVPPGLAGRQDVAFAELTAQGPVRRGVVLAAVTGHGPWFRLTGSGQVRLAQRQVEADLQLTPTAQAGQDLGPLAALAQGTAIPVQVSGPLDAPAVRVDLRRLLRQRGPEAVERLLRQPPGAAQDLLRGLLGP